MDGRFSSLPSFLLILVMIMTYQGYYGILGSKAVQGLKGLIDTRDCMLESFAFTNTVIRPDVLVNGEPAKECNGTSDVLCLRQNKFIVPHDFCTSETQITLFPGSPPKEQVYSAKELCDEFPSECHKGQDHTPYSIRCYYEYILGLGIPLSGGVLVAGVTVCLIIILCTYRKRSKKGKFSPKDDGAEELGFGVKAEDEAEERFVGGQMSARNTFERFLTEVEAICKAARPENVLALLSLGQRCQRSSCKDSCCSHPPFYLHIKIGETELLVNYVESIEPDALKVSADSIVSYAKSSKVSKSYRGFVFYRDAAVDPRALALLDDCWSKNGIGFYNVDIIERDPLWYKLWKDLLQTLIRHEGTTAGYVCEEQAESDDVSDGTSPPTETETRDVHVVSIEVTDNELEKNEHVMDSGLNPTSMMQRSRSWHQKVSRGEEESSDMTTNVPLNEENLPQLFAGTSDFVDIGP